MPKQLNTALYARGFALCPPLARRASAPLARLKEYCVSAKITLAILALMIGASAVFAQQKEITPKKSRFNAVKEYASEQEYITDKYKGRPWVNADSNSIKFYDASGRARKEIKGKFSKREDSDLGPHSKHVDIFDDQSGALIEERSFLDAGQSTATWTILGADGNEKGRITDLKRQGYLTRSPKGKYFLLSHWIGEGYGMDGKVAFFDSLGKKVKEQTIFDWEGKERIVFSEDGAYAAYLYYGMGKGGLAVLDDKGNLLGKHEEPSWNPLGPIYGKGKALVYVFPKDKKIFLIPSGADLSIECFDFEGNRLWKTESLRPAYADWVSDFIALPSRGRLFATSVGPEAGWLYVFNSMTGSTLYKSDLGLIRGSREGCQPWEMIGKQVSEAAKQRCWSYVKLAALDDGVGVMFSNLTDKSTGKHTHGLYAVDYDGNLIEKTYRVTGFTGAVVEPGKINLIQRGGK